MKIIRSTRNHRLSTEFPLIAEFGFRGSQETLEFGRICRAFERRFGPHSLNDWGEPTEFNQHWRKEVNTKHQRRRIYFKSMKDWTWAQLSK